MRIKRPLTFILFFFLIPHTQSFAESDVNKIHATRIFLLGQIARVAVNAEGEVNPLIDDIGYVEAVKVWLKCILAGVAARQFENESARTVLEVLKAKHDVVDCLDVPANILRAHQFKFIKLSAPQAAVWNHLARH